MVTKLSIKENLEKINLAFYRVFYASPNDVVVSTETKKKETLWISDTNFLCVVTAVVIWFVFFYMPFFRLFEIVAGTLWAWVAVVFFYFVGLGFLHKVIGQ